MALADDVRGNRYRPSRLRIVHIPKRTGGQRRIAILTVTDRVLQRATLQALLPRLDRKFLGCSYGYRPKRGVAQAVASVLHYRDRGMHWLLEADIDDCFGSLDHAILRGLLRSEIGDERVLNVMDSWLEVGRPRQDAACGIAMGMPLSPLWANLYLHELDWRLVRNRWPLVRYADDFVVLAGSPDNAERARGAVEDALAPLKLRVEPTKTRISSFEDGFEFLGVRFQGNQYAFIWKEKRVTVTGKFKWLWSQYLHYDY